MFKIVAVFAVLALAKAVPMGRATGKLDTTGVDAPDETVKAFSKGLFESCAAVREAGACSHAMAAKHCAVSCHDTVAKLAAAGVTEQKKPKFPCNYALYANCAAAKLCCAADLDKNCAC